MAMDDNDVLWSLTEPAPTNRTPLTLTEIYAVYAPASSLVDRFVTPLWYAVGFPGNLLAFAVWIRPRMRHSSGCYLAALAAADFLFLLLHLVFEMQSAWGLRTLNAPVICEAFPVFFLALQYLSPLLVLAFTVERYISVCHPFKREEFCTTQRAVIVIILLCVGVLLLHLIQAYFWRFDAQTGDCGVRQEVSGIRSVWTVWSWITELLVFGLVPIAMLALNALVIAETRRMAVIEHQLVPTSSTENVGGRVKNRASGPSATTVMLLAVSFYLIAVTLPVTVVYAVYFSFPEGGPAADIKTDAIWQNHLTYWTIRAVVQEIGMSHYAGNIIIYVATGKIFRSELWRLFTARRHTPAKAGSPMYRRHSPGLNANINIRATSRM